MKIKVIETLSESQILELATLYKQEGWTKDRKLEDIERMINHCKIIGLIDEELNKLVGFTRIITDYIYRATLRNIERVELYCAEEKVKFYNKWGFNKVSETTNFLRRINQ